MKSVFVTLALIILLFLITNFSISYREKHELVGFFVPTRGNVLYLIILGIAMIAGIIAGHLNSRFKKLSEGQRVDIIAEIKSAFQNPTVWCSLFSSPLIFGVVYNVAIYHPDYILATVLAFQNGFFCQVILGNRR